MNDYNLDVLYFKIDIWILYQIEIILTLYLITYVDMESGFNINYSPSEGKYVNTRPCVTNFIFYNKML